MGVDFSKGFPLTVTCAHVAFGLILGRPAARWAGFVEVPLLTAFRDLFPKRQARTATGHSTL
jgi:hypothetical protein